MYLVLDQQNIISCVALNLQYVRNQQNSVKVLCKKETAEMVYVPKKDRLYSLSSFKVVYVEKVPNEVAEGWRYNATTNEFASPVSEDITMIQLAIAELAEAQASAQTTNELALAELAEMIGG